MFRTAGVIGFATVPKVGSAEVVRDKGFIVPLNVPTSVVA